MLFANDTNKNPNDLRNTMVVDEVFASDMALLATTSALLHYALGFYGMVAAFALLGLAENGASLWAMVHKRSFQLWHALATHTNAERKTFDRKKTWRFGRRDERTRSDAWTETDDDTFEHDDHFDGLADQLLETNSTNNANNANFADNANNANATNEVASPPMDRRTQQLLAKLSIRDVASYSPFSSSPSIASPPAPPSTSSTASSSTTSFADRRVAVNTRAPVAFETDLFVGHALFLVRTSPEDPFYTRLFAGKRRMFWIQVQGRFKRPPRGAVYLGGELPGRVTLGLFTKSIACVIIGIIQSLVGRVYMSFGGDQAEGPQNDLPAVAFPLYQSVDQFMVTPQGETPPPLGRDDFGESEEARTLRRHTPLGRGDHVFAVGPTYSFHFHTMYVDLTQWQTANLPGLSDMQLATFFDSLPLRLVAYDVDVGGSPHGKHLQRHKQYLFNFEVAFDAQRSLDPATTNGGRRRLWRSDSEQSFASSSESTGTPASITSTTDSMGSPCPTVVATLGDDQTAILEALATIDRENARALRSIDLQYLYWIEELDMEMGVRRVQYVFRLRETCDGEENEDEEAVESGVTERLVIVSAYRLRLLLGTKFRRLRRLCTLQGLRFHARSRLDSYSIICDEARQVSACLQRLLAFTRENNDPTNHAFPEDNEALVVAFESALYQMLTTRTHLQLPHDGATLSTELTPASIGVKVNHHDRLHASVLYRFYADTFLRQEVMVLTPEALHFYRAQSSSPDKRVACDRIIGVQAASVPYHHHQPSSGSNPQSDFAFALQINTFAEEIVVCVTSEHARNAWIRVLLQHCCPHANFDRSLAEALVVCYTPTQALKPAKRVILNSRSLFPRTSHAAVNATNHQDAVGMVATALRSALRIHALGETADVMTVLEFLNHANALRTVDLPQLMEQPHETRLAFFLNLYHVVLAHAMIAHGFPRTKSQWESFQTHMCYVVGHDPQNAQYPSQPLSMSLAEIEHIILRARLPPASELPHCRLSELPVDNAARLTPLGMAHPDFRVSFALQMHASGRDDHLSVDVFHAETLHDQLNAIVKQYVAQHLAIDTLRQTIFLPRLCEWFKHDFGGGGSPLYCVRKLLGFMDDRQQHAALELLDSPTLVHIKYGAFQYAPRTTMRLATDATNRAQLGDREENPEEH